MACDCQEKGGKSTLNVTTITSFTLKATPLAQKEVPAVGRVHFLSAPSGILGSPRQDMEEKQHGFKPKAIIKRRNREKTRVRKKTDGSLASTGVGVPGSACSL